MAINKKLIHFKNFSDFNSKKLSANEENTQYTLGVEGAITTGSPDILYQSICWIKDTKKMWTHGTLYSYYDDIIQNKITAIDDRVSVLENTPSPKGITIVDSVDQLDPNAELGSLASVVTPGSIQETSFRDLYQPDASMLDQELGVLTAPELLSSVSSVNVFVPQNADSIVESIVYLVTRDFSMTTQNMAIIGIIPQQGVMAVTMVGGYDTYQQLVLAEYSQDTMSYTIRDDQVEAFNTVLANGMDWCYLGCPDTGFVITEEQFATIDLFLRAVASIPSKAHVYLKKDNWEELYAKDFEKLTNDLQKLASDLASDLDETKVSIPTKISQLENDTFFGIFSEFVPTKLTDGSLIVENGKSYFITVPVTEIKIPVDNVLTNAGDRIRFLVFVNGYSISIKLEGFDINQNEILYLDCEPGFNMVDLVYMSESSYSISNITNVKYVPITAYAITATHSGFTLDTEFQAVFADGDLKHKDDTIDSSIKNFLILPRGNISLSYFLDAIKPVASKLQITYSYFKANQMFSIPEGNLIDSIILPSSVKQVHPITYQSSTKIHIPSLEKWATVQVDDSDGTVFSSDNTLYVKDVLWDGTLPTSIDVINSRAFSGLSVPELACKGFIPYVGEDGLKTNKLKIDNWEMLGDLRYSTSESGYHSILAEDADIVFRGYTLKEIEISDYVTPILANSSITKVVIEEGCRRIQAYSFANCKQLISITIGPDVTQIGHSAFKGLDKIESLYIPNNVTSIGASAFYGCTGELIIDSPVVETDYRYESQAEKVWEDYPAFYGWLIGANFERLVIGNSVTKIGSHCFASTNFKEVVIPDTVAITSASFAYCSKLERFVSKYASEDGRCLIVDGAMRGFAPSGISSYEIPEGVTSIGSNMFEYYPLSEIKIPYGVTYIGYKSFSYTNVTTLLIPDSVTDIYGEAFKYTTSLKSIKLSENISTLSYGIFNRSALRCVKIPSKVISISDDAIYSMSQLQYLDFSDHNNIPTIGYWYINTNVRVVVPKALRSDWANATNWSKFADQIIGIEAPLYFDINGYPRITETGHTWENYINSNFYSNFSSNRSLSITDGAVIYNDSAEKYNVQLNGMNVQASDLITADGVYTISILE